MFSFSCTKERKNEVPFSIAIGNGALMHECFPTLTHGNSKNEDKRGVSMEKSKAGAKDRSPDSLSLPNQNTILINIQCYYFTRYGKKTMKFN